MKTYYFWICLKVDLGMSSRKWNARSHKKLGESTFAKAQCTNHEGKGWRKWTSCFQPHIFANQIQGSVWSLTNLQTSLDFWATNLAKQLSIPVVGCGYPRGHRGGAKQPLAVRRGSCAAAWWRLSSQLRGTFGVAEMAWNAWRMAEDHCVAISNKNQLITINVSNNKK